MSHTYEKVSGNKAKLTFTIPAEQFDEAMQKAFLKLPLLITLLRKIIFLSMRMNPTA